MRHALPAERKAPSGHPHLRHRRSRDLDVFVHQIFDPETVLADLRQTSTVAVDAIAEGALNCSVDGVRVQFLHARGQQQIGPSLLIEGLEVGSLNDLAATKLKTIGDRGELRDYYDLMRIETHAGVAAETGLRYYAARYGVGFDHPSVPHIVRALGSFTDVADDPWLAQATPDACFEDVAAYWQRRQPEIAAWLAAAID